MTGYEIVDQHDVLNQYEFFSGTGKMLASATESRQTGFRLNFTDGRHPFKMDIAIHGTQEVLKLDRHYDFKQLQMDVSSNGSPIGVILEKGILKERHYLFSPNEGSRELTISKSTSGATFTIHAGSRQLGSIEKKWAGFLKEAFTQADDFQISFKDASLTPSEKRLIIAAAILIDMDYYESRRE